MHDKITNIYKIQVLGDVLFTTKIIFVVRKTNINTAVLSDDTDSGFMYQERRLKYFLSMKRGIQNSAKHL